MSIRWSGCEWLPSECKNAQFQAFPPLAPSVKIKNTTEGNNNTTVPPVGTNEGWDNFENSMSIGFWAWKRWQWQGEQHEAATVIATCRHNEGDNNTKNDDNMQLNFTVYSIDAHT